MSRIVSIFFRAAGMGARFLLIFILAKKFSVEDVGLFGYLSALSSYMVFIAGFEYHAYAIRQFVIADNKEWRTFVVSNQFAAYFCSGLLISLLFLFYLIFSLGVGYEISLTLLVIVVAEHFSQELSRIMNVLNKQLQSSFMLFLRLGSWAIVVSIIVYFDSNKQNLHFVFYSWALANLLSVMIAIYWLRGAVGFDIRVVSFGFFKKGILTSCKFFLGMFFLKSLFIVDKVFVSSYFGDEYLGIYVYYFSGAVALSSLVDSGVYVFQYPKIMRLASKNIFSKKDVIIELNKMKWVAVWASLFLLLVMTGVYLFSNHMLSNPVYRAHALDGVFLFLAFFFYTISISQHYGLYVFKKDYSANVVNFICFLIFCLLVFSFSFVGALIVPISMCMVMILMCIFKSLLLKRAVNHTA